MWLREGASDEELLWLEGGVEALTGSALDAYSASFILLKIYSILSTNLCGIGKNLFVTIWGYGNLSIESYST